MEGIYQLTNAKFKTLESGKYHRSIGINGKGIFILILFGLL